MSSNINYVRCKQCKSIGIQYFPFVDTEVEWFECPVCGYAYTYKPLFDRKRQAADPEHRIFIKWRKDGYPIRRTYIRKGYGAFYIKYRNGRGSFGCFHKPITPKEIAKIKKMFAQSDVIEEECYLSRWNEDVGQVEAVVGTIAGPFENIIRNVVD